MAYRYLCYSDDAVLNDAFDFDDYEPELLYAMFAFLTWTVLGKLYPIRGKQKEEKDYPSRSHDPTVEGLICSFRRRAHRFRNVATVVLIIIVAVLLSGAFVFTTGAGRIAIRESNLREEYLITRLTDVNREIASLERHLLKSKGVKKEDEKTDSQERLATLKTFRTSTQAEIESEDKRTQPPDVTTYLVSSMSTRIGSVLLLVFLVQILVSLYRYTMRLAAFYDSRADILKLMDFELPASTEKIISIFRSDSLDFGKQIVPPTTEVLNVIKEAVRGVRR